MFSGSIERDQWHKMGCKTPQGSFPFKKSDFLCYLPLKFTSANNDNFWNNKSCHQHPKS